MAKAGSSNLSSRTIVHTPQRRRQVLRQIRIGQLARLLPPWARLGACCDSHEVHEDLAQRAGGQPLSGMAHIARRLSDISTAGRAVRASSALLWRAGGRLVHRAQQRGRGGTGKRTSFKSSRPSGIPIRLRATAPTIFHGCLAEWSNAPALNTGGGSDALRGFDSHSIRHPTSLGIA
jgi:hypothetical protein